MIVCVMRLCIGQWPFKATAAFKSCSKGTLEWFVTIWISICASVHFNLLYKYTTWGTIIVMSEFG